MARRAFTLVELLVIVAIIGVMTTAAVLTITSGQTAVRIRGATRDVYATIRQARSTALVTQKPAIITYSNGTEDGEPVAKIEITSAKLLDSSVDRSKVQTITGEPIKVSAAESEAHARRQEPGEGASEGEAATDKDKESGRTVEEILFSSISDEVVRGVRIKVLRGDELPAMANDGGERAKPKISVFSNVDYLLGRFKDAKDEAAKKEAEKKKESEERSSSSSSGEPAAEEGSEPVSIVWETNGRVEPHQVWVYPDGARPEDGQLIRVDRFGGAKVVSGDGREDD